MSDNRDARMELFECSACGHQVRPEMPTGEKGEQRAACSSCDAVYVRTFALFEGEWVFGLWRNKATGKVACSMYKTAFGADDADC
ncbi:zinc ribbon domain-containing protein [Tumebacillus sp. DT12]|uniref:Zinc ribbon domain-containing protein n=1 Tax=Tumebacillus lacus TaxID=2995335 RepID=A0ABT3WWN0_9BACL|nr:zinc ribbon domain-containing protein [Tumebacillus lacus]MCX7569026.1 zinc ribbon domain-containing protein [Tumebacillus lacus]